MGNQFAKQQARIEALFAECADRRAPDLFRRVLGVAHRGVARPEALTPSEIRELCYALIVHYAHMGIVARPR